MVNNDLISIIMILKPNKAVILSVDVMCIIGLQDHCRKGEWPATDYSIILHYGCHICDLYTQLGSFWECPARDYSMILQWGCHICDWYTQLGCFWKCPARNYSMMPHNGCHCVTSLWAQNPKFFFFNVFHKRWKLLNSFIKEEIKPNVVKYEFLKQHVCM